MADQTLSHLIIGVLSELPFAAFFLVTLRLAIVSIFLWVLEAYVRVKVGRDVEPSRIQLVTSSMLYWVILNYETLF